MQFPKYSTFHVSSLAQKLSNFCSTFRRNKIKEQSLSCKRAFDVFEFDKFYLAIRTRKQDKTRSLPILLRLIHKNCGINVG